MRIVPQNEFFTSYKLPPSRVRWATIRAKEAAEALSAPAEMVTSLDELLQLTVDFTVARRAWKAARTTRVNPQLAASDNKLDRSFSNFVQRAEMDLEDYGADSVRGKAAQNLLDGPLNVDVFSVTNATREEQEAMTDSILTELEANHMPDIQTCGLEAAFAQLKDNFADFVDQMSQQASGQAAPTTEQLGQLKDDIESKMVEVIHRVNGAYPTAKGADRDKRSAILGPFAIQNDRAAAFYKRNRGAGPLPDIDPDTGEDVVDEPANDDLTEPEPVEG